MYFFQPSVDSIFYINNILNLANGEIKIVKYNRSMESEDIIKINNKYFSDASNKIFSLEKNQLYIIYYNFDKYEEIHYCITN